MNEWLPALGRSLISLAILGLAIGGFFLMGTPEVPTQELIPDPPPLVATSPAIAHTEGIDFEVDGVVVPYREIQIAALVAGRVEFKSEACRSGMTVEKGDLLVRIEPDDYELEVQRLDQELKQADAMIFELDAEIQSFDHQIESSNKQLALDAKQLKRNRDLMLRRAASDSEVDSAMRSEIATQNTLLTQKDQKALLEQRRIRMVSAKALVKVNLEKAQLNLKRTEIVSPIDGVVVSESVEQDGYIQSGGTVIVLQDTSRLDVTCKIYMHQMHWLWQSDSSDDSANGFSGGYDFPKTPATIIYELGDENYAWTAVADRYDGAGIDNLTRMVPCRVHVDDPTSVTKLNSMSKSLSQQAALSEAFVTTQSPPETGSDDGSPGGLASSLGAEITQAQKNLHPPTLMTGMFVKVRVHANPPISLVRLPQEAIQPGNTVWTVHEGTLKKKPILIVNSTPEYVVARRHLKGLKEGEMGLQAGDLVVTSPLASPFEGMKVRTDLEAAKNRSQAARQTGGPGASGPGTSGPRKGARS